MVQRSHHQPHERDEEPNPADRADSHAPASEEIQPGSDGVISSPIDFYQAIRKRPDIAQILDRLARS